MINQGLSERRSLRVIGTSASANRYESAADRNCALKEKIITLAQRHRRYSSGYVRSRHKYSSEQRQVAVEHYLDHDRCIASIVRALGYPCREILTGWIDELHPEGRHRIVVRTPNVQHPRELKNAAVIELCTRTTGAQEIAHKLAVCRLTLYNGKNQLLGREAPASMKRPKESFPVPDATELQRQVESLQHDFHRLQLEHDLLKKANELLK